MQPFHQARSASNRRIRLAFLGGSALFVSGTAVAQDIPPAPAGEGASLETTKSAEGDIIVSARNYVPEGALTASKSDIPLIETPQSISVITRDQIDLLSFVDAQQAVRYTAGVFGENYGPDPRYDFVTVRGFTPKQYIDGLAVPATTTISAVGVDLYAFQSLDILKGPSSVLYGAAPPGGILNETSRRALSHFGGEVLIKGGTNNFGQFATSVTGPVTSFLDVRATMLYRDSKGDIDYQRNKRLLVSPTATLKLGDNTRLTGLLYYQYDKNKGGNGGFLPAVGTLLPSPTGLRIDRSNNLDSPHTMFERRQTGAGFDLQHKFGGGLTFHSNTKWSHYREETPTGIYSGGGFINTNNPADPSYYRTLRQYNFSYAETVSSFTTDNRLDAKLVSGALTQKILLGVDYRKVANASSFNFKVAGLLDAFDPIYDKSFDVGIGFPFAFNDQKLKQTGIYAQDQLNIGNLFVTASGRYDWVKVTNNATGVAQKDHKFTYRIGANYVTDAGIAPYVSYATSFEPVLGKGDDGKPYIPTLATQFEAGVKLDARGLPSDVKLFATIAAFDIKEKNFVVAQVGATPIGGMQGGEVEVYGAEFELVARIREQLSINGSYSYNHSEIKSSLNKVADIGFPLPTTPKHKASIFADYTFQRGALGGFGFGGGVRYNSKSAGGLPSATGTLALSTGLYIETGEATLFDAIVHYDAPGYRIALNGSNLADKNYIARCAGLYGCVYGAGRQVLLTLTGKF
ncbi:TonB-dependent siderophore receptor [Sphingomonas sp. So64.6b]|uniref:TonB-dependent siderophore receptor n=1 Tax=Sphingomonas sp. So64.6b TaxID=2997354 RepID=UPI0015FEEB03|nr:TonB-dependent siderophore receptor [Sphingomonas sp. So64.6b]QNA86285.1 TonB-dependent siderophore receptor [Sphingomonas sp. So64.6b]